MTSVRGGAKKWQSLERKLKRGKSLEQAAEEAGVELKEAEEWLEDRRAHRGYDDDALALVGAEALHHGVKVLIELTRIRDGRLGGEGQGMGMSTKWDHPDLPAAQTLVKTGIEIKKMLRDTGKRNPIEGGPEDLFDRVQSVSANWVFADKDK